jgi:hypothetical protein
MLCCYSVSHGRVSKLALRNRSMTELVKRKCLLQQRYWWCSHEVHHSIRVTPGCILTKILLTRFCANLIHRSSSHISTIVALCDSKTDQITLIWRNSFGMYLFVKVHKLLSSLEFYWPLEYFIMRRMCDLMMGHLCRISIWLCIRLDRDQVSSYEFQ